MPLAQALSSNGVLAIRDLSAPEGKDWQPFHHGRETITPAPFYLVWEKDATIDSSYPWPYQLTAVKIVSADSLYRQALPISGGLEVEKGFVVFKEYCIRCHSMNLAGGTMGPELNVPKNITEYWQKDDLKAFIKDASSFHANSKMPSFPSLSDADLKWLMVYLESMRTHKIKAQPVLK
jgi:mono/diheme cytochrome c family protein